jgi:predicted RNase H-like HicB family nuclease
MSVISRSQRGRLAGTGSGGAGVLAGGLLAESAGGYPGTMPEMPRTLTAALHREEDWYIAQCLEVDVASQGHTIDEALANLAEAVELYLEDVDDPVGHITATPLVTSFRLPAA